MCLLVTLCSVSLSCAGALGQQTDQARFELEKKWNWGHELAGVRVGLSVDKLTYALGEDVPLHVAVENASASVPIFGEPFLPRPIYGNDNLISLRMDVLDEDGPLRVQPPSPDTIRTGGGPSLCPVPFEVGKAVAVERSLRKLGLLPTRPGEYEIIIRWRPYTTKYGSCDATLTNDPSQKSGNQKPEEPYVTVSSMPLYIRVKSDCACPDTDRGNIAEYTGWKRDFALVDTSFGEKTALLDKATGLEWLRLNFTANRSNKRMLKEIEPGGEFQTWRLANVGELRILFGHFTGTADGHSTDPAMERKLQRLLGGPLDEPFNSSTGWHRTSTDGWAGGPAGRDNEVIRFDGHIREDSGPIATIEVDGGGSVPPDFASPSIGTFLVRQH
jgi:hypothetical protein